MWKTGHSVMKAKMKEEQATLAGEISGHMFFADRYFGYDDAIYASCRLLEILLKAQAPFSSLLGGSAVHAGHPGDSFRVSGRREVPGGRDNTKPAGRGGKAAECDEL